VLTEIKERLKVGDQRVWPDLVQRCLNITGFEQALVLSTLRKKAKRSAIVEARPLQKLRIAFIGGYTLHPFTDVAELLLWANGFDCEIFVGEYDSYISDILSDQSNLYSFNPQVTFVMPSEFRCLPNSSLIDSQENQRAAALSQVEEILNLCRTCHERSGGNLVVSNFALPSGYDLGAFRSRTLGSNWSYKKLVNLELGLRAPAYVQICDTEFLSARRGLLASRDDRAWFESKQPFSPDLLVDVCRELAHVTRALTHPPKKVLVLDADNTLWGGVIADDGVEGIEIGDTSPKGQAFKEFQKYALSLKRRGVLLALCSKNDESVAMQAFESHPEMVLRRSDFASFKANWNPKPDNLREIAAELNLGLDSLAFFDDNPSEIEIVRQWTPEVAAVWLGQDPSTYLQQIQDCRLFEPVSITAEDVVRADQYQQENARKATLQSAGSMDEYLKSLQMIVIFSEFVPLDTPRVSQLINKSNQFNLTTIRRSEAEVALVADDPQYRGFSVRLADRFGDHGLISIVIAKLNGTDFEIDTWLMSCRVLQRQVELEVLNEITRLARATGCHRLVGRYLPTAKNKMVEQHYPKLGFSASNEIGVYYLDTNSYLPKPTHIKVNQVYQKLQRSS
jgi:FkbH-like protein